MGKSFIYTVKILQNQTIIKEGPYKYLEHPSYSGGFLIWSGIHIYMQFSLKHLFFMSSLRLVSSYYKVSSEERVL